jgi:hypothetical protein
MQAILFSTAARGSHIYQPAQAPLAIVHDDEEPINLSKAFTAATSMAAAISTASNLTVAVMETLPLMDVNNNSHIPSMTPLDPPPSLPSGSGSGGKRTHSVMLLDSEGLHSASTKITTPSTNANPMLKKQAKISWLTDIFEKLMFTPDDGMAAKRSLAISQIQEFEDGLMVQQKVKMISKFQKDVSIAQTYLDLLNGEVRQAWLQAECYDPAFRGYNRSKDIFFISPIVCFIEHSIHHFTIHFNMSFHFPSESMSLFHLTTSFLLLPSVTYKILIRVSYIYLARNYRIKTTNAM